MKVNTDGVLLGALMTITPQDCRLLDIGTGTGTIALMAAQRLRSFADAQDDKGNAQDDRRVAQDDRNGLQNGIDGFQDDVNHATDIRVYAIDIDEPSATEAAVNFRNSPWSDILRAHHASLEDFAALIAESCAPAGPDTGECSSDSCPGYDLIFSNPPYFDNALQAPEERRNNARHTSTGLSYREILDFAADHLTSTGRVAMVLPADTEHDLTRHARMCGLHLHKITRIRTVPRKAPSRIVAEFSRHRTAAPEDTILTIQVGGQYTQEYLDLMHEFYLFA